MNPGLLMMVSGESRSPPIADTSVENMKPPKDWERIYTPIRFTSLLICILGIIGNGMLIYLLRCRINKTRFTVYVLNISIADFILTFNYFIYNVSFFRPIELLSLVSALRYITVLVGNCASIYFLTVITVERYFMAFLPVWYHFYRPEHFTALMCIILWVLSLVIALLEYFSCNRKFFNRIFNCDITISIHFICNFMAIITVVVFSTVALFTRIERQPPRDFPTKFDRSILAAIVLTLVFWVPMRIVDFLHVWIPYNLPDLFEVSLISEAIYSSSRPYIYLLVGWWKNQEQQRSILVFIESAMKHTEENTDTETQQDKELA